MGNRFSFLCAEEMKICCISELNWPLDTHFTHAAFLVIDQSLRKRMILLARATETPCNSMDLSIRFYLDLSHILTFQYVSLRSDQVLTLLHHFNVIGFTKERQKETRYTNKKCEEKKTHTHAHEDAIKMTKSPPLSSPKFQAHLMRSHSCCTMCALHIAYHCN